MYAILRSGGKQYKVAVGDVIRIEKTAGVSKGQELKLSEVLLVSGDHEVRTGPEELRGVSVNATVLREVRSRKILVFKKKRRKQYRRTRGHRQSMLEVRIDGIEG